MHGRAGAGGDGRVVVGVDGSAESLEALRFAFDEARRRGTGLLVIAAFESPELWSISYDVPVSSSIDEVHDRVLAGTGKLVAQTLPDSAGGTPGPAVDVVARPGNAAHVLVSASLGSPLLVVGSRGLGGFRRMLLGSVSMQCVQHAHCPVTVVRTATRAGEEPAGATGAPAAAS